MKLANLFLITALVGVVAAIGCSDDPPSNGNGGSGGTAGSGGTGGNGADVCTGGLCETADVRIDCDTARAACKADTTIDMTDAECDAAATEFYCNVGDPGTGGTGGDGGGGTGGTGVSDIAGCNESLCATDPARQAACEEFWPLCVAFCNSEGEACGEDECAGFALVFICNEQ